MNYLLNKQIKQKTNKFLLFFLFLLPILTNSIIFEAYYENPKNLNDTLSEQDLLNKKVILIQHKDGTYSLCNGKGSFFIDNPKSLIESGIKVVEGRFMKKTINSILLLTLILSCNFIQIISVFANEIGPNPAIEARADIIEWRYKLKMEEYINVVIITLNKNGLEIGFQHRL